MTLKDLWALLKDLWALLKESWNAWSTDKAPRLGAALAYYTLFSLAPLLVIVIAVAALVFGQEAAQGKIVAEIQGLVGEESARAIQTMIDKARAPATGIVATILSLITLLLGATGVVGELKDTLNTIWHVQPAPEMGPPAHPQNPPRIAGLCLRSRFSPAGIAGDQRGALSTERLLQQPVFQSMAPVCRAGSEFCRLLGRHYRAVRHALSLFARYRDPLARCVDWSGDDRTAVRD